MLIMVTRARVNTDMLKPGSSPVERGFDTAAAAAAAAICVHQCDV